MRKKEKGIYIHIPFCQRKCNYCDFYSFINCDEDIINQYINSIIKEIKIKAKSYSNEYYVNTIFIGGGTPSIIKSEYIVKIINAIYESYDVDKNAEISIECNPNSLNKTKIINYMNVGINRISLGVQSFNNKILKILGRIHTYEEFEKQYFLVRNLGFDNINLDLMFGVPELSYNQWIDTLEKAVKLNPEHMSFYSLQIEEGTYFYNLYKDNKLNEPDKCIERNMYHKAIELLSNNGYIKYEISNCSKKGFECKHNLKYWNMQEYTGIGLGAHSFMRNLRYSNLCTLKEYIEGVKNTDIEIFTNEKKQFSKMKFVENIHENNHKDNISEFMITGLRKSEGINLDQFEEKFNMNFFDCFKNESQNIKKWIKTDKIKLKNNRIFLTNEGIDLSNEILSDFVFLE